jgi:lysophospholipid acyltransferase (LPLAT)-like uncharacterized protein
VKLDSWRGRALIAFVHALFQLWARTLRLRLEDPHNAVALTRDRPVIVAIWHNRLFLLPIVGSRFFPHRQNAGLISVSRDGDLLSKVVERCGHSTIRGSSSRKGMIALRQAVDTLASGTNVWVTPDGPRGPVYQAGQGTIFLAQKSETAIVPLHMEYSSSWRLKSWDHFFVPRPFCRVRIVLGAPLQMARTTDPEQSEVERLRLQKAMMSLVEQE